MTNPAADVVEHDGRDLLALTEVLCGVPSVFPDEGPLTDAVETRVRKRAGRSGKSPSMLTGLRGVRRLVWTFSLGPRAVFH